MYNENRREKRKNGGGKTFSHPTFPPPDFAFFQERPPVPKKGPRRAGKPEGLWKGRIPLTPERKKELADFALQMRTDCIRMTNHGQSGHIGSMLSMTELVAYLYNGVVNITPETTEDPERDRFILSKGHAGAAVYAALCRKGYFPEDWLMTYYRDDGKLMGHISHHVPGVEFSTGSLGHGLPVATGMTLAAKTNTESSPADKEFK